MDIKLKANVKHNGKWYKSGEEIKKVKKEDGERLVDLGVAIETNFKEAPKDGE